MNIHRMLLCLYPRAWRTRYEEEFLVVLTSRPFSLFEEIDVIRGALDAHLNPLLSTTATSLSERICQMLFTLRRSLLTIFCAYIGFILAGMGFQKMTEDAPFQQISQTVSFVSLSFHLVIIGAVVALLAVLVGGLPIVVAVIRSALAQKRYGSLLLLAVPFLAFALFLLTTSLLKGIDHAGARSTWNLFLYRGIFFGVLLAAAVISTGAVCCAVGRSEIPEKLLYFAVPPSILATLSMVLVLVAIIIWGLGLHNAAPQFFTGNNGLVGTSTAGTWLGIVIAIIIATGLSTVSLLRGLSVRSALHSITA